MVCVHQCQQTMPVKKNVIKREREREGERERGREGEREREREREKEREGERGKERGREELLTSAFLRLHSVTNAFPGLNFSEL